MSARNPDSIDTLRFIAKRTTAFSFPNLTRPSLSPEQPASLELVNWGAQVYSFSWLLHLSALLNGLVTLEDAGNRPSAIILARSVYELGAHAYYVKKHLKQHIDAKNFDEAWKFLLPVTTGSRYMTEKFPSTGDMFPTAAHISKMIKCFSEVMPEDAIENYSFLSEFSHPNSFAFGQHHDWMTPYEVSFVPHKASGMFGATAAACLHGLMAIRELLHLTGEESVKISVQRLLIDMADDKNTPAVNAAAHERSVSTPCFELTSWIDLVAKAKFDFASLEKLVNSYDVFNCLCSLNCIPEWIKSSEMLEEILQEADRIKRKPNADTVRQLCNRAKHFKRLDKSPETSVKTGYGSGRYGIGAYNTGEPTLEVEIEGKMVNVLDLLRDVLAEWEALAETRIRAFKKARATQQ